MEVEGVGQQEQQGDQRDDEEGEGEEKQLSEQDDMRVQCEMSVNLNFCEPLSRCSVINLKEKQSRDADTNNKEDRLQKQTSSAVVQSTASTSHWMYA